MDSGQTLSEEVSELLTREFPEGPSLDIVAEAEVAGTHFSWKDHMVAEVGQDVVSEFKRLVERRYMTCARVADPDLYVMDASSSKGIIQGVAMPIQVGGAPPRPGEGLRLIAMGSSIQVLGKKPDMKKFLDQAQLAQRAKYLRESRFLDIRKPSYLGDSLSVDKNAKYFYDNRDSLLRDYPGEWVAIDEGMVIAHDRTLRETSRMMHEVLGPNRATFMAAVTPSSFDRAQASGVLLP